ncbi:hypothetical protein, partial [Clostridioides difficile]|uniref:hypothetical protein n=1 Tax=Clostridioides difficile TaxID=1496 RepID=UPI00115F1D2D
IDVGISKKFLIREDENAKKEKITSDCRHNCNGCGINIHDIGRCLSINFFCFDKIYPIWKLN